MNKYNSLTSNVFNIPRNILKLTGDIKETIIICYLEMNQVKENVFIVKAEKLAEMIKNDIGYEISVITIRRSLKSLINKNILFEIKNDGTIIDKFNKTKIYSLNIEKIRGEKVC